MKIKVYHVSTKKFEDLVKEIITNDLQELEVPNDELPGSVSKIFQKDYHRLALLCASYIYVTPKNFTNTEAIIKMCNSEVFFKSSHPEDITEIEFGTSSFVSVRDELWGAIRDYYDDSINGSHTPELQKEIDKCLN